MKREATCNLTLQVVNYKILLSSLVLVTIRKWDI